MVDPSGAATYCGRVTALGIGLLLTVVASQPSPWELNRPPPVVYAPSRLQNVSRRRVVNFGDLQVRRTSSERLRRFGSSFISRGPTTYDLVEQDLTQWSMRCSFTGNDELQPMYRWACSYTPARPGTPAMTVALSGEDFETVNGYVLSRSTSTSNPDLWRLSRSFGANWELTQVGSSSTSSVATTLNWRVDPFELVDTASISSEHRRFASAVAASTMITAAGVPRLNAEPERDSLKAFALELWPPIESTVPARHAAVLYTLNRPELSLALREKNEPEVARWFEAKEDQRDRKNYYRPFAVGMFLNIGPAVMAPIEGGDVARRATPVVDTEVGLDLGNRAQLPAVYVRQAQAKDPRAAEQLRRPYRKPGRRQQQRDFAARPSVRPFRLGLAPLCRRFDWRSHRVLSLPQPGLSGALL